MASGAAVVGAVAAKKSGDKQADAAGDAADAARKATKSQIALEREMWQTNREDYEPWREAGAEALELLRASPAAIAA